jgi:hypothetical protein
MRIVVCSKHALHVPWLDESQAHVLLEDSPHVVCTASSLLTQCQ